MNTKSFVISSVLSVSFLLFLSNSVQAALGTVFTAGFSVLGYKACRDAAAIDGVITDGVTG
jgi:hypothetical protein